MNFVRRKLCLAKYFIQKRILTEKLSDGITHVKLKNYKKSTKESNYHSPKDVFNKDSTEKNKKKRFRLEQNFCSTQSDGIFWSEVIKKIKESYIVLLPKRPS